MKCFSRRGRHVLGAITFFSQVAFLWEYAASRTWTIAEDGSGDAPTIQAGIDSAQTGDTVFVQTGRFVENIDFLGKEIVVRGSGAGHSVLDGSGQPESCVRFWSGEGRSAILQGFTITGGTGSCPMCPLSNFGGGIYIRESEPTIRENEIVGNEVTNWGGGIFCEASILLTPLIEENVIRDNRASRNGGGIGTSTGALPIMRQNLISRNMADDGDGGGIWIWTNYDGAVITSNQIVGNLAGDHGGGIYAVRNSTGSAVSVEISYNVIANNIGEGIELTTSSGGGIWMQTVEAWIHHNTLVENEAQGPDSAWGGGGIALDQSDNSIIEQNIIAFSTFGGGIRCNGPGTPTIRNNLAWMNVGGNGAGACASWWQSNGNIVDNPYFCDLAGGDYRVASNSGVMTHPAGPLGVYPDPGCGPVFVQPSTWGALKARYK